MSTLGVINEVVPVEIGEILVKGLEMTVDEHPLIKILFEIDGKETEKYITPSSLWVALNDYYSNRTTSVI